jgi:hypothetical protein
MADWRLCFVCFHEPKKMHLACFVSGYDRPTVWGESATEHGFLVDKAGYLFSAA